MEPKLHDDYSMAPRGRIEEKAMPSAAATEGDLRRHCRRLVSSMNSSSQLHPSLLYSVAAGDMPLLFLRCCCSSSVSVYVCMAHASVSIHPSIYLSIYLLSWSPGRNPMRGSLLSP